MTNSEAFTGAPIKTKKARRRPWRRQPVADVNRLRQRVVSELTTTFASHYTKEISLRDVATVEVARAYNRRATGEKFLIIPTL